MINSPPAEPATRSVYVLIGALALIGLGLRIAGAQGGLWLDEAWSADFARKAKSPIDIFFVIHHDNNHYLNTLWMYLAGWGAPPMVSRLLSIVTGTVTILIGGLIGLRRGAIQGILLALFFAISPMLVAYGAEARGYAPMFLALTSMIWVVARWLDHQQAPVPSMPLALITAFGMLSHLTMLFALIGIGLWSTAVLAKGRSLRELIAVTVDLFGLSAIVAAGILVMAIAVPLLGPTGFQFGGYDPFSMRTLGIGLSVLFEYVLGLRGPIAYVMLPSLLLLLPLFFASRTADRSFILLCIAALLTVPVLFVVARIANAAFARYQLLTCFGLLLVASEVIASGWMRGSWRKPLALVALGTLVIGQFCITLSIITNKRADPSAAITAMASRAPGGASISVGHMRDVPVIEAAAATARYPLKIKETCPGAHFAFLAAPDFPDLPPSTTVCDMHYTGIAGAARTELSGMSWRLYARDDVQAARRSSAARSTS